MSALPSEADIRASFRHVCLGPKPDIARRDWHVRFVPQADMFPNSEAAPVEAASQFKTAHIAVGSFELAAKGSARDIRELVPLFARCAQGSQKQGICYDREPRNPV
jgi:hypothetical protein